MPKNGSLRGNTKVTAVTALRILGFIYHLWPKDYRKKIIFAGFFETTLSRYQPKVVPRNEEETGLLSITRMYWEDIVVVNRNYMLEI